MKDKKQHRKSWMLLLYSSCFSLLLGGCYASKNEPLSSVEPVAVSKESPTPAPRYQSSQEIVFPANTHESQVSESNIGEVVTLTKAAEAVLSYHPKIRRAREFSRSEETMIDVAKSGYLPKVHGGFGTRYDHNARSQGDKKYQPSMDFEVSQTLYDFGQTASAVKSANFGFLSAEANSAKVDEELIYTATSSVVFLDALETQIQLAGEQVKEVAALVRLVEERHSKGASNLSDLLQAESRLNEVKSQQLDIRAQYQSQLQSLAFLLGKPHLHKVELSEIPQNFYQACDVMPEWEQVPDYAIANFEIERAAADADYAGAEKLPTIDLRGNYSRRFNHSTRRNSQGRDDTRVSLNFSVPLYEGGRLNAHREQALTRVQMARAERDDVRLEINQLLADAKVRLRNRMDREQLLHQRVENLRGTKELYRKQYLDLGSRTLLDLLNSEQEFHVARVEAANNRSEMIQVALDCAFYKGELRAHFGLLK